MTALGSEKKMQRGNPPHGYVTANTAKRWLGGISDGMLRSYVQRNKLKKLIPDGRAQGFYKLADIQAIIRENDGLPDPHSEKETGVKFMKATEADIPEIVDLLITVFEGGNTAARRISWLRKNPEIAFIVRTNKDIKACVFVMPLTEEKLEALLHDPNGVSTGAITADDLLPYEQGKPVCLYIMGAAVKAGVTKTAKRVHGARLVAGVIRFLYELGERGVPIKCIAGRSETNDGIKLMQSAGFTEIESHTDMRVFMIDVEKSGLPKIMKYKKMLREKLAQ